VRTCIHRDECLYMYEYLCLYGETFRKKILLTLNQVFCPFFLENMNQLVDVRNVQPTPKFLFRWTSTGVLLFCVSAR
jgi:hypothetical protein